MDDIWYNSDGSKRILTTAHKKKWAKVKRSAELGLWMYEGHKDWCVMCVCLTTWSKAVVNCNSERQGESRNCWKQLIVDNRHLRHEMKRLGFEYDDWYCCEVSPKYSLLHLHGFMRFPRVVSEAEIRAVVSELWGKIHHSPDVDVRMMWDSKRAVNYDVKHAVKNYMSEDMMGHAELFLTKKGYGRGVIKSKGWLPSGWKNAQKWLNRWALSVRDYYVDEKGLLEDGITQAVPEGIGLEYVFEKWKIVESELRRWCKGETIEIVVEGHWVMLWGGNILEGDYENDN